MIYLDFSIILCKFALLKKNKIKKSGMTRCLKME